MKKNTYARSDSLNSSQDWTTWLNGCFLLLIVTPIFIFLFFLATISEFVRNVLWISLALGLLLLIFVWLANRRSKKANSVPENYALIFDSAKAKIANVIALHLETLARRRLALIRVDHYGVTNLVDWDKEVQHFMDEVVWPKLSNEEINCYFGQTDLDELRNFIENEAATRADQIGASLNFDDVTSPEAFERWCAAELEKCGWVTTVTKASGDQGADVLARKGDRSIVLQCKLYSSPVGNKAVQEAFSAQRHYAADRSAVVTNADYTKSARELSQTTKVLLLHFSDLSRLENLMSESI